MEVKGVISELYAHAKLMSVKYPDLSWYVFGSALASSTSANDIDVLIIYECESHPREVRLSLDKLSLMFPLDLIFMTASEARQLDFFNALELVMMIHKSSSNHEFWYAGCEEEYRLFLNSEVRNFPLRSATYAPFL